LAGAVGLVRAQRSVTAQLEADLREAFRVEEVLLTDSGTAALTLALIASQREQRAPVALPAWACYDLATAAVGADVRAVLYDLDPHTLQPEPESLRNALHSGARTVVIAHLYGMPVDLGLVREVLDEYSPLIIDDAAQGIGAAVHGRPLGSVGSLGILSFGRGKGVTGGAGGALLASDVRGAGLMTGVREHLLSGRSGVGSLVRLGAQWVLGRPSVYGIATAIPALHLGETRYHPPRPMHALARASASALRVTRPRVAGDVRVRRAHASALLDVLAGAPQFEAVRVVRDAEAGYLRLPTLYAPEIKEAVMSLGARRLGIQPGYPDVLANVPSLRERCVNAEAAFPGARALADRLCTFPTHHLLCPMDLEALRRWIVEAGSGDPTP